MSWLSAGGDILGGFGALEDAKYQEKIGNYNASIFEQNATTTRNAQELLESQKKKSFKSQEGTAINSYAHSGVKLTGSPIDVLLDSHTNANMDIAIDKYNSEIQARGFQNQANVTRYEAKQRQTQSYFKAGASFLNAGSKIVGSISQAAGAGAGCWVAAEIFGGWEHPKTMAARYYVNNIGPVWFKDFYLQHGESIACFIKNKPFLKNMIQPLFERFAKLGENLSTSW